MPRKTQPPQPSEVAPEVTPQEAPKAVVTEASPVTKASPKPRKVDELPHGATIETY